MSLLRRWGLPALLLSLSALALPCAARAADDNPGAKSSEAVVREALKNVINEGADMYNGQGKYTERDYLGCYHLYEGALITIRPLLAAHADLQKAIDDGLDNARNTPRPEMRAFVLRDVIDKIREGVKSDKAVGTPGTKSLWERLGGEAGVSKVVDDFVAAAATDPKVDFTRGGKHKLDDAGVAHLKKELVDFVSSAAGGPFKYTGKSMKDVHKGMHITDAEFDAAGKDLKDALEKNGVKADDVKAVLGAVETTRKDIVEGAAPPPPPPPPPPVELKGRVKAAAKDKVVITAAGKDWDLAVTADTKITIDGREGKAEDIKKDAEVTATKDKDGRITEIKATSDDKPKPPGMETLWERLGGETNVAKVVDDFVNAAGKDPKVNFFRDPTVTPSKEQVAELKTKLVEFVSSATGGPLKYTGKSMKEAHKGMKITDAEFDALAADLKAALEKNGAKPDDVKAVLGAVEGTRKDIVEIKDGGDKPKLPEDKKPEDKKPDDKQSDAGKIEGKVTYKGKPLPAGVVTLIGADGKTYTAKITEDGTYSVKDVKAGVYKITVDAENPGNGTAIPVQYKDADKTPLRFNVRKGDQTGDLQLMD